MLEECNMIEIKLDLWIVILVSILNAAVTGFGVALGQEIFKKLELRRKKMMDQILNKDDADGDKLQTIR